MLNPLLICTQRPGEDQVTYALACTLQEAGSDGLGSLLAALGLDLHLPAADVVAEVQPLGLSTRPDARIEVPGHLVVLLESKAVPDSLRGDQVEGHVEMFGAVPAGLCRVLLAITPDASPPGWWPEVAHAHDPVIWLHGTWQQVFEWARIGAEKGGGETTGLLLRGLRDLLRHEGLGRAVERHFDAARVGRVQQCAEALIGDLVAQHDTQEALLEDVLRAFEKRIVAEGVASDRPVSRVASRWRDPHCWSPVSSYARIDWSTCPLEDWPMQTLWVEVFLDRGEQLGQPARLRLRSGVLVEGRAAVQRWFGRLQDAGKARFDARYRDWHRRSGYGESWAYRDFAVEDRQGMVDGLVDDLAAWVAVVLPALARPKEP